VSPAPPDLLPSYRTRSEARGEQLYAQALDHQAYIQEMERESQEVPVVETHGNILLY